MRLQCWSCDEFVNGPDVKNGDNFMCRCGALNWIKVGKTGPERTAEEIINATVPEVLKEFPTWAKVSATVILTLMALVGVGTFLTLVVLVLAVVKAAWVWALGIL